MQKFANGVMNSASSKTGHKTNMSHRLQIEKFSQMGAPLFNQFGPEHLQSCVVGQWCIQE
jgi:hypothetical protein